MVTVPVPFIPPTPPGTRPPPPAAAAIAAASPTECLSNCFHQFTMPASAAERSQPRHSSFAWASLRRGPKLRLQDMVLVAGCFKRSGNVATQLGLVPVSYRFMEHRCGILSSAFRPGMRIAAIRSATGADRTGSGSDKSTDSAPGPSPGAGRGSTASPPLEASGGSTASPPLEAGGRSRVGDRSVAGKSGT